jgi:hypothetical protein
LELLLQHDLQIFKVEGHCMPLEEIVAGLSWLSRSSLLPADMLSSVGPTARAG